MQSMTVLEPCLSCPVPQPPLLPTRPAESLSAAPSSVACTPQPSRRLGSMGAPAGRPATTKSGLTSEHILSRLQSGFISSRETGQELGRLGDQMGDIGDTLGGNNVSLITYIKGPCIDPSVRHQPGPVHSYPQFIPPVRPRTVPLANRRIPSCHPINRPLHPHSTLCLTASATFGDSINPGRARREYLCSRKA